MIKKLVPHLCIILAIVMLTLLILAQFNQFVLSTDFYSIIMYAFFGLVFITSGLLIALQRKE